MTLYPPLEYQRLNTMILSKHHDYHERLYEEVFFFFFKVLK